MNNYSASWFLGANTPGGFVSLFDSLYEPENGWRLFIIKGGPGTGKSTLMKKIAAEADKRGYYCERIYCSSDPNSLDGVIIPRLKISVADGTPPHAIEPKYPGVSETIIDLGTFRDDEKLRKNADDIIMKTQLVSAEHKKCVSFLSAASAIEGDIRKLVFGALRSDKLVRFTNRLSQSLFGSVSGSPGKVTPKFLSALTPEGGVTFYDTFDGICERRIVLDDDFGMPSSMILNILTENAVSAGYDCVVCPCPMSPGHKKEHLLIPSLSLGFFTSDKAHPYEETAEKRVDCKRFFDMDDLRAFRGRISFDRRAKDEMLDEAVNKLVNAKKLHDELEKYYIDAMDFDRAAAFGEQLIDTIFIKV